MRNLDVKAQPRVSKKNPQWINLSKMLSKISSKFPFSQSKPQKPSKKYQNSPHLPTNKLKNSPIKITMKHP
jgi:hypothetical protein